MRRPQVLTIVSMLSVPSVFFRPPDRAEESDAAREKFFIPESDHLTLLHVYQQWKNNGYRADWCSSHFLQPKGARQLLSWVAVVRVAVGFRVQGCNGYCTDCCSSHFLRPKGAHQPVERCLSSTHVVVSPWTGVSD